jgi:hypothetical protein
MTQKRAAFPHARYNALRRTLIKSTSALATAALLPARIAVAEAASGGHSSVAS